MPAPFNASFFNTPERLQAAAEIVDAEIQRPRTTIELTTDELKALASRLQGSSLEEIARRVVYCTSERSVMRKYLRPAAKKLGALGIVHAPRLALEEDFLPLEPVDGPRQPRKSREVLELMSIGLKPGEIAVATEISVLQVDRHTRQMSSSLGATSDEHLVMLGFQTGNITPGSSEIVERWEEHQESETA